MFRSRSQRHDPPQSTEGSTHNPYPNRSGAYARGAAPVENEGRWDVSPEVKGADGADPARDGNR